MSRRPLIVSLHDVHPGSLALIRDQIATLETWGVQRTSALIVPEFHHEHPVGKDTRFADEMSRCQEVGHELVLHGYFHDRQESAPANNGGSFFWTQLYSPEAEFFDLPSDDARARIRAGREVFAAHGWRARGFVAPAWLMTPELPQILRDEGFLYTNRIGDIIPLQPDIGCIPARSLCYSTRAWWRRVVSQGWNAALFTQLRRAPRLRLSLHPRDFLYPALRVQIERIVKTALHDGFVATTYADDVAG